MKYILCSPESSIQLFPITKIDSSSEFKVSQIFDLNIAQYKDWIVPDYLSIHRIEIDVQIRTRYKRELICEFTSSQRTDLYSRKTAGVKAILYDLCLFGCRSIKTDFRILTNETALSVVSLKSETAIISEWEEIISEQAALFEASW